MSKNFKIYGALISGVAILFLGLLWTTFNNHDTDVSTPAKYRQMFRDADSQKKDIILVVYGADNQKDFNQIKGSVYRANKHAKHDTGVNLIVGSVKFGANDSFKAMRVKYAGKNPDDNAQLMGRIKMSQSTSFLGKQTLDVNDPVVTTAFQPVKAQVKTATTIYHYVNAGKNWAIADSIRADQSSKKQIVNFLENKN